MDTNRIPIYSDQIALDGGDTIEGNAGNQRAGAAVSQTKLPAGNCSVRLRMQRPLMPNISLMGSLNSTKSKKTSGS